MMYQSKPCLPYFSSVVKNVANPNIEVKKLVYIYLLHYAETDQDLALLSVNAIQKSLTDQNPQVRAMALRTMAGMRVPVISQIVSLAIKRGCGDMSPHVRKAAALAIPKCFGLDPNTLPQLTEYLSILLGDKQYFVAGPAVAAFLEICPNRIDLIHKHYRGLVRKLVDMDEWSQLATLRLLMNYSRRCFSRKTERQQKTTKKGFYDDEADEVEAGDEVQVLDPDLELFLKACKPLLQSRNSAVIIAVVSCFLYLGTPDHLHDAVGPLIALLRSPPDIRQIALHNIASVALISPTLFVPYASHFLLHTLDPPNIYHLKLELLTLIFPSSGLHLQSLILSELSHFSHSPTLSLVRASVIAIGRCAQTSPTTSPRCFRVLLALLTSADEILVSEALTVIRHLIQQDPSNHTQTIVRLARNLDTTTSPAARATIIWLVGEFAGSSLSSNIAPDVLRILARSFADEPEEAKQQIVLLAAKVYLHYLLRNPLPENTEQETDMLIEQPKEHQITLLWRYILLLTRYDTSYDVRDRARLFKNLLVDPRQTQLASLILLAEKPVPVAPSPSERRRDLVLGSASLVLGMRGAGYEEPPEWVREGDEPDGRMRGEVVEDGSGVGGKVAASKVLEERVREQGLSARVEGTGNGKGKTLNDWLDEEEEDGDGESGTEEESSEEGSMEEDSESEEEEDEEEEDSGESKGLVTT